MGNNQQKSSLKRHSVLYGHSNEYADDFEAMANHSTTANNQDEGIIHTSNTTTSASVGGGNSRNSLTRILAIGGGVGDRKSLTNHHHHYQNNLPTHLTITSSSSGGSGDLSSNSPSSSTNKRFTVSLGTPTKDKKQRNPNNDHHSTHHHTNILHTTATTTTTTNPIQGQTTNNEKRFSLAAVSTTIIHNKKHFDDRKSVSLSPSSSSLPKHKRLLQLSPHKSSLTSSVSTSPLTLSSSNEDDDIFNNLNPSINIQEIIAVLRDPLGMQLFYEFCEQQLCTENIELFKELEMLEQRLSSISSKKRSQHIKSIHDRYLSSSSEMEVNVSHSSRKLVERERFSKKIDIETSKTVLEFLKRDLCTNLFDSFSRFIQTKEYKSWRETKCTSQMIKNSLDNFDSIIDSSNINIHSIDEELTGSVGNNSASLISLSHVSDSTFDPVAIEDFN